MRRAVIPSRIRSAVVIDLAMQLSGIIARLGTLGLRSRQARNHVQKVFQSHPDVQAYYEKRGEPVPTLAFKALAQYIEDAQAVIRKMDANGAAAVVEEMLAGQREVVNLAFAELKKAQRTQERSYLLELISRASDRKGQCIGVKDSSPEVHGSDWTEVLTATALAMQAATAPAAPPSTPSQSEATHENQAREPQDAAQTG